MEPESLQNTMTSTTSSSGQRFRTQPKPEKRKLIVEEQAKIDRELDNSQKQYSNRPSTKVVVIKWISTVVLGALLLGCLCLSKVSVIALSSRMHANVTQTYGVPPPTNPQAEIKYMSQLFVMLLIIALVPNVVSLIRGLFFGLFRKDIPWPSKKGFILATVVSLLEAVGLSLFVFKIADLTETTPYLLVLLMHSVFLVPVFTYFIDWMRTRRGGSSMLCLFVMAAVFEIVGIGGTLILIYKETPELTIVYALVTVLCLSISWSPLVQRNLIKTVKSPESIPTDPNTYEPYDPDETDVMETAPAHYNGSASTYSGGQSFTSESKFTESYMLRNFVQEGQNGQNDVKDETKETGSDVKEMPPTWKLTIYMSFLKIVFILTAALILFKFTLFETKFPKENITLSNFANGWDWGDIDMSGDDYELYYFVGNIAASGLGYIAGYIACTTCMQRFGFTVPLIFSTPLSVGLLLITSCDFLIPYKDQTGRILHPNVCDLSLDTTNKAIFFAAVSCLCLAQICCSGWLLFQSQFIVLMKEVQLFWTPMYNSVLLEQWLILVRKNEVNDDDHEDPKDKVKRSKVVICTTMYREADYEMRQLLESIQRINRAQSEGHRSFETHVFFDGAVKDRKPQEFVLQLVSLAESTLGVKAEKCTKNMTPYGMTLSWKLENNEDSRHMLFVVHLKDNFKVKNKKRWSQVMYMSYVMDYLLPVVDNANEMETYILTTDADVKFTPDSVEALLDLMTRDHSVGAVCSRTHPLGSGPLVWYQVFEYAIGHWFQKAAEHVIGSVLCSPGCFSVYRCKALRDILPRYAENVEHAFDFLTKDMGEDRWLCTLMVQSGWRIEYCAAAENSTHCPEEFDEFYKQRRRWVASTLANIMLLLKEWKIVAKLNHRVTFIFMIYQAILLFATLIGPSSVMLVVSGGLVYGWKLDPVSTLVFQILVTVALTFTCLFCSSKTQLNACKFVTFVYSVVMTVVVVGIAVQIIQAPGITDSFDVSTTTLYIGGMAAIFLLTGLLHLGEFVYLLHGVWFLLCLPSGYLVLIIYSVCNITDRSWGTREVKAKSVVSRGRNWQENLEYYFKQIFFCCFKKGVTTTDTSVQTDPTTRKRTTSNDLLDSTIDFRKSVNQQVSMDESGTMDTILETDRGADGADDDDDDDDDDSDVENKPQDVSKWLSQEMAGYAKNFKDAGFENTMLIAGMTEKELKDIGVKKKGIRQKLMADIKVLPDFEIQAEVPEDVDTWLKSIGLHQYAKVFKKEQIKKAKDMEILKSFGRAELEKELKITKPGHIKRMLYAIKKLRNPTERERKLIEVQKSIDGVQENYLKDVNPEEYDFWDTLRTKRLLPQSTVFGSEEELKSKLGDLRNAWLMVFAVSNTLWLILIETLASQGEILETYGSNPVGLLVLVLFSLVLIIQFFAMIVHRVSTLTHFLARAPYKFGDTFNTSWAFNEKDLKSKSADDQQAIAARNEAKRMAEERLRKPKKRTSKKGETQPLLRGRASSYTVENETFSFS